MTKQIIYERDFNKEFIFSASRSSGPGGQNVNKVNSKVELRFNISTSQLLTDQEKLILLVKLKNLVNLKHEMIIVSQTERSQLLNKQRCIEKFHFIITNALTPVKIRKASTPTRTSKEKRIDKKKRNSINKNLRRKPDFS